jgi:ATPase family associated with various cellular activities (AAA)/Winged helix domain, variant
MIEANWQDSNQQGLCRELERVYAALVRFAGGEPGIAAASGGEDGAVAQIVRVFGLSPFERDILLLCAGVEFESRFADACAAAQKDPRLTAPTFSLALGALPGAHWSAVNRDGALRYWRLIETGPGGLLRAPLRIDERILHFLAGVECFDERLDAFIRLPREAPPIATAHASCARRAASYWAGAGSKLEPVVLAGRRAADLQGIAAEISRLLGRRRFALRASDIPHHAAEREQLARIWNREAALTGAILSVETHDLEQPDMERITALLDRLSAPVLVEVREGSAAERLRGMQIRIPALAPKDRKAIWTANLGERAAQLNGHLDRVAESFDLDGSSIRLACDIARGAREDIWDACRTLSRRALEGLAQRIEPRAAWADLVLPQLQIETLKQIVAHVRQRALVHGQWGFGERYSRGLGITALFAGASGTGKTMAAEVVARELDLDLYQIDLAGVVSKYIGETEKNLRRIFDAAEDGGAVLLFDEADAIFGKRSEVKDSHDRYANLEISYLLQRMEAYRGLAILTTNMKHALDDAFLRRLRFIVQFPFPGTAERQRIWERVFPAGAPLNALDFTLAAKLNISGGVIRNIATHAAFLAADEGAEIGMTHIMTAARVEYAKIDRPLTPTETGGWK